VSDSEPAAPSAFFSRANIKSSPRSLRYSRHKEHQEFTAYTK
jgi:hypothetical protein